ncbi:hypothetical protein SAMN06265365_11088 [Tistlia consotensis]|uniref:Uncharacterized protein n=1 Tax=Tistlia consotensis USBA 355 TaxID=560819 RepID=A0A1Y6BTY8_9PROT|nr:hypothetical protein [Tistlia consotensis]SMF27233.1 hypothetical protein SAMN05428998_10968 [Tistlia consotensis USBA 355]SNR66339.1 hypothetical protein SAMN06265365_11088 [Tistlia consotensis]
MSLEDADARIALVERAGPLLYGSEWQRALARGLGPLHPEGARPSIDDSLVRKWVRRARPVPDWVSGALMQLLRDRASALEAERADCEALIAELAGSDGRRE